MKKREILARCFSLVVNAEIRNESDWFMLKES